MPNAARRAALSPASLAAATGRERIKIVSFMVCLGLSFSCTAQVQVVVNIFKRRQLESVWFWLLEGVSVVLTRLGGVSGYDSTGGRILALTRLDGVSVVLPCLECVSVVL